MTDLSPSQQKRVQAAFDALTARRWDAAGYEIKHEASLSDLKAALQGQLDINANLIGEIERSEKANRPQVVITELRTGFMQAAERYDQAKDVYDAILVELSNVRQAAE